MDKVFNTPRTGKDSKRVGAFSDRSDRMPRIILLQGPVGPFFDELARSLEMAGADVTHILLNSADKILSTNPRAVTLTDKDGDVERNLAIKMTPSIDCVVLFGSERPAHKIARQIALQRNIPVLSFEEGYIRPGAIALERSGNNASSPLTKLDISKIPLRRATRMEAANYKGYWPMVFFGARYYLLRELFAKAGERELFHRETPITREFFFWTRAVVRKIGYGRLHTRAANTLASKHKGNFFLVPLQVPSDSNVKRASNGWTTVGLITESMASFAANAPTNTKLIYKIHPMSRGHSTDTKLIYELAKRYSIQDRVHVLYDGSLGELTKNSAGMVTINSTSGLSAIHHGVPLLCMGKAIYAHPQLCTVASQISDIDGFWKNGRSASLELRNAFLAHVRRTALLPGDFYARRGRRKAIKSATKKIIQTAQEGQM